MQAGSVGAGNSYRRIYIVWAVESIV